MRHLESQGVGGAIVSGYKWAGDHGIDIAAVMAGDAEMDPDDLPALLGPVASGLAAAVWSHASACLVLLVT